MTINAVDNNLASAEPTGNISRALNADDFLKIMITELTNQDPFEPMKNQDLLNQMATIQQLQSSQQMSKSFENLMERYDSLLVRQQLSTASGMIGQLISGNTTDGQFALGKVVAVTVDGEEIMLELDTGQRINVNEMARLGGSNSQDIVGQMAIGMTAQGDKVVGKIVSVEVDDDQITLHLQVPDKPEETVAVPLRNASIINNDTADLLIGYSVKGLNDVGGIINSVEWSSEGVILNVLNSQGTIDKLPLEQLTRII